MIIDRVLELRRRRLSDKASRRPPQRDPAWQQQMEALEARVAHLESELEGLQDATHRQAIKQDQRIEQLRRHTAPAQVARDLTEDARRRGL